MGASEGRKGNPFYNLWLSQRQLFLETLAQAHYHNSDTSVVNSLVATNTYQNHEEFLVNTNCFKTQGKIEMNSELIQAFIQLRASDGNNTCSRVISCVLKYSDISETFITKFSSIFEMGVCARPSLVKPFRSRDSWKTIRKLHQVWNAQDT